MTRLFLSRVYFALAVVAFSHAARANRADDLAQIHLEALGGRERVTALSALRAAGYVVAAGHRVRFSLTAARPNRARIETGADGRTLIQATDGVGAPWEFDTGKWPPRYVSMAEAVAKTFSADSEFDDPLVSGAARGFAFEYGGETEVDGKRLLRVNVKRLPAESFSILLDTETYLIVLRVEKRSTAEGRSALHVTRYEDYRPVDGVLLPHRVTNMIDGKVMQQTVIDTIVANPELTADSFTRPRAEVPESAK